MRRNLVLQRSEEKESGEMCFDLCLPSTRRRPKKDGLCARAEKILSFYTQSQQQRHGIAQRSKGTCAFRHSSGVCCHTQSSFLLPCFSRCFCVFSFVCRSVCLSCLHRPGFGVNTKRCFLVILLPPLWHRFVCLLYLFGKLCQVLWVRSRRVCLHV